WMAIQVALADRRGARRMALIPVIALSVLAGVAAPASAADAQAAKACSEHPSRVGSIGGIQWAQASAWRCSAGPLTPSAIATQPNPPYKGSPPLTFHGGVVAGSASAGELTVTPVYWVPSGGPYSIPAGYESLITRFITDAAHLYMYFLPEGVETCFSSTNGAGGGTCTINASGGLCGYHAFAAPPLVADMAYAVVDSPLGWTCSSDAASNTGANESPNGN